jgi:putative nucleotidyltransferase with HDIG domain
VVVLDYWMPDIDGLKLAKILKSKFPGVTRIMLTGCVEPKVINEAVKRGEIYRYLIKPWDSDEILETIEAGADITRNYNLDGQDQTESDSARYEKSESARSGWAQNIMDLVPAVEARDPYTLGHSSRVTELSTGMGNKLGLNDLDMDDLEMGALLHDVGKLSIPDFILFKPSRLEVEEMTAIQEHSSIGGKILADQLAPQKVCSIVRHHHENFDGTGYPDGQKGDKTPIGARIIRLADSFDAMHHKRKYRDALPMDVIISELENGKGTQFDPELVPLFLNMLNNRESSSQLGG